MADIKEITDATFEQEIQDGPAVLVDFWAPWCGPCRMTAPVLEKLAVELDGSLRIVKMNVDEQAETARGFGIRSIPTMILFKDGQAVDTIVGFVPGPALKKRLGTHLPAQADAV